MNSHAKTNSTPKLDALPRQNFQRQFPYVREHSTPKPRRRQHLLDGLIFTAPRPNSVLGGKTDFHAETSFHAETTKLHVSLISLRNSTLFVVSTPKPRKMHGSTLKLTLRSKPAGTTHVSLISLGNSAIFEVSTPKLNFHAET